MSTNIKNAIIHNMVNQKPEAGELHHIEINVSDLSKSTEFWGWFLEGLGYQKYQEWKNGKSWRLKNTYIVFVQTETEYFDPSYHRKRTGLNHLAFHAGSRQQVDGVTKTLKKKGIKILYPDRHPYAGGYYAVYFEDPNRIKIELVAPK